MSPLRALAVACFAITSACGSAVVPADDASSRAAETGADARRAEASADDVVRVDESVGPDAASFDEGARVDEGAPDGLERDADDPDAATRGEVRLAQAQEICGVSLLAEATAPGADFTVAWAEHRSLRENEVHVAQVDFRGSMVRAAVVGVGIADAVCLSVNALASPEIVAWTRRLGAEVSVEGAVLDERGGVHAWLEVPPSVALATPENATNMALWSEAGRVSLVFAASARTRGAVRLVTFDASTRVPSAAGSGRLTLPVRGDAYDALPQAAFETQIAVARGIVAYTERSPAGGDAVALLRMRLFDGAWVGPAQPVAFEPSEGAPSIVSLDANEQLLFSTGAREQTLYQARFVAGAAQATPRLVARATAWNRVVGASDPYGNVLWSSRAPLGGYNNLALLASERDADPLRCVAFRTSAEDALITTLAHARRASRNQLVAMAETVRDRTGYRSLLRLRGVGDGQTVCE